MQRIKRKNSFGITSRKTARPLHKESEGKDFHCLVAAEKKRRSLRSVQIEKYLSYSDSMIIVNMFLV